MAVKRDTPYCPATVLGHGSARARRWVIPWGNNAGKPQEQGKDEDTKLTRTLKILPDAASDLKESDCFRVMRWVCHGRACTNGDRLRFVSAPKGDEGRPAWSRSSLLRSTFAAVRRTGCFLLLSSFSRQLQHVGATDGKLEDVPLCAQEPAQKEQPGA